jgi:hypothetical protein
MKEALHRNMKVKWLNPDAEISSVEAIDLSDEEDFDSEDEIEEKKIRNEERIAKAHQLSIAKRAKVEQLRKLPPAPWLNEDGSYKSSWTAPSGVEMEVVKGVLKCSAESLQTLQMFIHRLHQMGDYPVPSQMKVLLSDASICLDYELDLRSFHASVRGKFTARQLRVAIGDHMSYF